MNVSDFSYLSKWRFFGVVLNLTMAFFANLYLDIPLLFGMALFHASLAFFYYPFTKRRGGEHVNDAIRKKIRFILGGYFFALVIGLMAFLGEARIEERITSLLLPVIVIDLIMSILSIGFLLPESALYSPNNSSSSDGNSLNSAMVGPYGNSGLSAHDSDTYWHQSPHYTASSIDSSPAVNPASGLIMIDNAIDVAGNFYGFNDHSFSNDISQTNQFSDYDYHNNN